MRCLGRFVSTGILLVPACVLLGPGPVQAARKAPKPKPVRAPILRIVKPAPPSLPLVIPVLPVGVYTGAYCPDPTTGEVTEKSIYDFQAMSGKKVFFVHLFVPWLGDNPVGDSDFIDFPTQTCDMIRRLGAVPLITWQPNLAARDPEQGFLLDRITQGEFDEYLRSWATKIKAHPGPVFIRWGQEPNGDWFSWSGAQNGGNKPLPGGSAAEPSGPARYRRAWQHLHNLFRIEKVANMQWVWSVYHSNVKGQAWNEAEAYWPGDDRADWIGIGAINWSRANRENWKKWRSFSDLVDACYKKLTSRFPAKPIFLAEFGCANQADASDGDKVAWIRDALRVLPKKYPRIKALCWYNHSVEAQAGYYPANFRLDFAPHHKVYHEGIARTYYLDAIPKGKIRVAKKTAKRK